MELKGQFSSIRKSKIGDNTFNIVKGERPNEN
jgi:hypothetical protein